MTKGLAVPGTWAFTPLGELLESVQGGFASGVDEPEGTLQLRMNNVTTGGRLDWTGRRRVPCSAESLERYELRPGDVVFNSTNSPSLVGKAALFQGHDEPVVFSNHFLRLRTKSRLLDPEYLSRWLTDQWRRRVFEGLCTQWVNQAAVRKERLLNLRIPVPPLPEQRRIAAILDRADAIRRKRQETIRLTDELLRATFLDMFGDPGTNPHGWAVKKLIDLVNPDRPITYGILKPGPDVAGGIPYVRVIDINGGRIAVSLLRRTTPEIAESYRRSKLEAGDLLLSIRGQVGRMAVVPLELDGANITQDTARLAPTSEVDVDYLRGCLESGPLQHYMARRIKGAAVKGINLSDVKELPVPVPSGDLQLKFGRFARKLGAQTEKARAGGDAIEEVFSSLVQRAFRGEL